MVECKSLGSARFITRLLILLLTTAGFVFPQSGRDRWQQPEKIIDAIDVQPGMVIGEAGAGDGYFTFKLSPYVGEKGLIYANDIDKSALRKLENHAAKEKIKNIKTILGELTDPLFPDGELDMLIMVYVFHDLAKPLPFLENIKADLKPGAPLVLVEGDPEKYYGDGHFYRRAKVVELATSAGYALIRMETFLSRDTIYIFQLEASSESSSNGQEN